EQGKRVAILRNMTAREPSRDTAQAAALAAYLDDIQDKALYREYRSLNDLLAIVDSVLNDVSFGIEPPPEDRESGKADQNPLSMGVWPRGEQEAYQETDSRGRLRTKTKHRLVLQNDTGAPVMNVSFRLEDAAGTEAKVHVFGNDEPLSLMAPGSQHGFPLSVHMGSPASVLGIVTWTGPDGDTRETRATVSLI
ncbi:hypothetical protein, partial [Micrococcus terreus]|uniref:hypothetical protein n=1 Tax=Micrococcus terreus TaxID=574650 RepID=UPI0023F9EB23